MFTRTHDCSIARRRLLAAAFALGFFLSFSPASHAQQGSTEAGTPAGDLPANVDLDAAADDMEMSQTEVQQMQETLRDLGYFSGPADGRRGPRTREALRDFQTDQGLPITGSLDPLTVSRIGRQANIVGVPNQPPTDALDRAEGLNSQVATADTEAIDPATAPEIATAPVDPMTAPMPGDSPSRSHGGGVGDAVGKTGDVVAGAGAATVKGVRTGGGAAIDGVETAGTTTAKVGAKTGKVVAAAGTTTAKSGVVAGKAVATAGTKTVDGTLYVGKSVKNGTVFLATKTRDLFTGDRGTSREDEQIRQSLVSQYAIDDRLIASEIEVRVSKGHVTLAVPEGARSDMGQASRLAKITPGVKTVTTVFTSVAEQPSVESAPTVTVPSEAPIVDPELMAPPAPVDPAGSTR